MTQDRTMVDLFCGLGGASWAMRRRGWRVIRVDHEPWVKPDVLCDVRALALKPFDVDLLWASIPCAEFSKFTMRCWYKNPPAPDMSCAIATRRIIDEWRPRGWVVECTRGAIPFLVPLFGSPRAIVSGHVFWGSPMLYPQVRPHKRFVGQQTHEFKRKLKRAIIPQEISSAVCGQIEAIA